MLLPSFFGLLLVLWFISGAGEDDGEGSEIAGTAGTGDESGKGEIEVEVEVEVECMTWVWTCVFEAMFRALLFAKPGRSRSACRVLLVEDDVVAMFKGDDEVSGVVLWL